MAITPEQRLELLQRKRELLQRKSEILASQKEQEQLIEPLKPEGFVEESKVALGERFGKAAEAVRAVEAGEQTRLETTLQVGAQAAGGIFDVAFEGLKAVTPDVIEKALVESGKFVLKAPGVVADVLTGEELGTTSEGVLQGIQKGSQALEEFKQQNPRAARNLEAAFNLAGLIPAAQATKVTAPLVKRGVKEGVEIISKTAKGVTAIPGKAKIAASKTAISQQGKLLNISPIKNTKFRDAVGETPAEFALNRGLKGTEEEVAAGLIDNFETLISRKNAALKEVKGTFKDDSITTAINGLEETFVKRQVKATQSTSQGKNLKRIEELKVKHEGEGLSRIEVEEVKRIFERERKIPDKQDLTVSADTLKKNENTDDLLRNFAERITPEEAFALKEVNKEIVGHKELINLIGKKGIKEGERAITLTDAIILGETFDNPAAIAAFAGKKAVESEFFKKGLVKLLAPKGKKALTQDRLRELINFDQLAVAAEKFDVEQGLKKGLERRFKKEQIEKALVIDELQKQGFKVGEDFIVLPEEKKVIDEVIKLLPERAGIPKVIELPDVRAERLRKGVEK